MAKKRIDGTASEKATVIWLNQAIDDVERITASIAQYSSEAAGKAKAVVWDSVTLLAQFPRLAKLQLDGLHRQWPVKWGSSSIIIRYRVDSDNTVIILRLQHGREQR